MHDKRDHEIEEAFERIKVLEGKDAARSTRERIQDWFYTKCIWVWTLLLGWFFYGGIFLVEHYEIVAVVVLAGFKALRDMSK